MLEPSDPLCGTARPVAVHGPVVIISRSATLWVTCEGDSADYFVGPGERLALRGPGRIVVESLVAGEWQLEKKTPRRPARCRWRGVGVRLQP